MWSVLDQNSMSRSSSSEDALYMKFGGQAKDALMLAGLEGASASLV
jgi:hypothetical protein